MTDGTPESMRELVEDYALGLLDGADRVAFEAELARDPSLQAELAATMETLSTIALSTPVAPSAATRGRLMARIGATPSHRGADVVPISARRSYTARWLVVALAAACLAVLKLAVDLRAANATIETAQGALAHSDRIVAQRDSLLAQLTDPSTQQVTMAAQGPARPAMKAYLNNARRVAVVAASSLETLPAGQAYQLWFIVDGKPVPSVTFRPDSAGHALIRDIPMPAGSVAATAITREPLGGSPAPTSPVLFVGKPATE